MQVATAIAIFVLRTASIFTLHTLAVPVPTLFRVCSYFQAMNVLVLLILTLASRKLTYGALFYVQFGRYMCRIILIDFGRRFNWQDQVYAAADADRDSATDAKPYRRGWHRRYYQ
jgi:hypothetical protein